MARLDKNTLFKSSPEPLSAQDRITAAAREIIDAETQERDERTAKLRAARLARDAELAAAEAEAPAAKPRRKAAKKAG